MKITSQPTAALSAVSTKTSSDTSNLASKPQVKTAAPPQTQLSAELGLVQAASLQLNALPDVDLDKVAALRQAIAAGELPLDMAALSQAVLELHRS